MFRPGAKKSPEEMKLAELNEQVEASLKNAQWAGANASGLRQVFQAFPEIEPSLANVKVLEEHLHAKPDSMN